MARPRKQKKEETLIQDPVAATATDNFKTPPVEVPKAPSPDNKVERPRVPQPLKVEINFPAVSELKQAIKQDKDGRLIGVIQFETPVDPISFFRLLHVLKTSHGGVYATLGTNQAALDFKWHEHEQSVETVLPMKLIEAPVPIPLGTIYLTQLIKYAIMVV